MKLIRVILIGLIAAGGCAKTDEGQGQAASPPATQPAVAVNTQALPATQPGNPDSLASMIIIDRVQKWFPPAMLRVKAKDGKVIARLYSDDPKGVLTGKDTVNSYDIMMELPGISDPADISKTIWEDHSASMDKKDSLYGIFLNNQQDVLQPMNVRVNFEGTNPRMTVIVRGSFSLFHSGDQISNPAPKPVTVMGILDAKVVLEK